MAGQALCDMDQISVVFQNVYFLADTIENNIKIANGNATRAQVEEAAKKASIHDFILTLPKGYDTSVGELGDLLSEFGTPSVVAGQTDGRYRHRPERPVPAALMILW